MTAIGLLPQRGRAAPASRLARPQYPPISLRRSKLNEYTPRRFSCQRNRLPPNVAIALEPRGQWRGEINRHSRFRGNPGPSSLQLPQPPKARESSKDPADDAVRIVGLFGPMLESAAWMISNTGWRSVRFRNWARLDSAGWRATSETWSTHGGPVFRNCERPVWIPELPKNS